MPATMFLHVRRSLGERLLESTPRGSLSIRRIHAQNPIRGAIAQAQQASPVHGTIHNVPAYSAQQTSQDRKRKSNGSHQRSNPSNKTKQNQISKSATIGVARAFNGDPLATATDLTSPYHWKRSNILTLYTAPTEEELPTRLRVVHDWMKKPLHYLDNGLRLQIELETARVNGRKGNQGVRVKLVGRWSKHSEVAIGDGATKVLRLPTSVDFRKRPRTTLHCI